MRLASRKPRRSIFGIHVLSPLSKVAIAWSLFSSLMDLTYTAYVVPLSLAFNTSYTIFSAYTIIDAIGSITYFIDIIMGFITGFAVRWDFQTLILLDGPTVAKYYMKHGSFIIDTLALLPAIVQIILASTEAEIVWARAVALLKLLRVARVWKLLLSLQRFDNSAPVSDWAAGYLNSISLFFAFTILSITILINLMGCVWWWLAQVQGIENSWAAYIAKPLLDLEDGTDATRYVVSVYFAMTVVTTIGFGDITPQTAPEVVVTMLYMLIGVAFFGFFLNTVGELLSSGRDAKRRKQVRDRLHAAEFWMDDWRFSNKLKRDIRTFYFGTYGQILAAQHEENDLEFYDELPDKLRLKVAKEVQGHILEYTLFPNASSKEQNQHKRVLINRIAGTGEPVMLSPGGSLYEKDEVAHCFYLLDEGKMELGYGLGITFSAPALISFFSITGSDVPECSRRLTSAHALTHCSLWSVDISIAEQLKIECPEAYLCLLDSLIEQAKAVQRLTVKSVEQGKVAPEKEEVLTAFITATDAVNDWVGKQKVLLAEQEVGSPQSPRKKLAEDSMAETAVHKVQDALHTRELEMGLYRGRTSVAQAFTMTHQGRPVLERDSCAETILGDVILSVGTGHKL